MNTDKVGQAARRRPARVPPALFEDALDQNRSCSLKTRVNLEAKGKAALGRALQMDMANGFAAFLNSTLADVYFRKFECHTQVNASKARRLRKKYSKLGRFLSPGQ